MSIPTAGDLMNTDLKTAWVNDDIEDVNFTMRMEGIHHLPVLDKEQKLVGIVSSRDIDQSLSDPTLARSPISTIMNRDVISVAVTARADEAIELLIEHRVGSLPVLDKDGVLVGILTDTDFLHLALEHVRQRISERTGYHR